MLMMQQAEEKFWISQNGGKICVVMDHILATFQNPQKPG